MAAPESVRPEERDDFDELDPHGEEAYWQEMKERDEETPPEPPTVEDAALYLCAEIHNRALPETIERAVGFVEDAIEYSGRANSDLVAAAKEALPVLEDAHDDDHRASPAWRHLKRAIEKAEGR